MRLMDHTFKFTLLLVLLGFVFTTINASPRKYDFEHCKNTVGQWAHSSLKIDVTEDRHILRDLLFFLHVPRTGGGTYYYCFLKKLYSNSLECPCSYVKLRFDPSKPNCRLLVTHDDHSLISKLPKEKTSVMTILRNPIDRVFSTYEFSLEVAASFLVHPTSVTRRNGCTLDVWPWKYLVPWMREDLFARRDGRKSRGPTYINNNDSYNMEDIVMPLHEYINDPITRDTIHNGATFQVAGLTNHSYLAESHEVRHCALKYQTLGEYVLEVAKKRLDDMLYVGLTENLRESATMFANVVGAQVISQLLASNSSKKLAANNRSGSTCAAEKNYSFLDSESDINDHQCPRTLPPNQMTVGKIMEAYETCISSSKESQAQWHTSSLKIISPLNFTKEALRQVPEEVLQEITSLNSLDVELYKYAQDIFAKQHKHMMQKLVGVERQESMFNISDGA